MSIDKRFLLGNFIKDEKNKIIFYIHQKSGCTSFLKMIFENIGILKEALQYDKYRTYYPTKWSGWPHYYRYDIYQKKNPVKYEDLFSKEYKLIKLVRNPYTRIISSYLHILKVNKDLIDKDLIDKFFDSEYNISFYNFLKKIDDKNIIDCDLHLDLQICNLEKINKLIFDDIIKLEELKIRIPYINEKYNINLKYYKEEIHSVKKNKENNNFVGYKSYNDLINNIPNYIYFYNDNKIKNLVYKIFKDDINKYNYSFFNKEFISIGPNCNVAGLLQYINKEINNEIRIKSYPFDWINSNIKMVIDCIDNNFNDFLNISNTKIINNIENHKKYSDKKNTNIFVHHSIINENLYYKRCVNRFNKLNKNKIFIYSLQSNNIIDSLNNFNIVYGNLHPNINNKLLINKLNNIFYNKFINYKILIINYIVNSNSYKINNIYINNNILILNYNVNTNIVNGNIWKYIYKDMYKILIKI